MLYADVVSKKDWNTVSLCVRHSYRTSKFTLDDLEIKFSSLNSIYYDGEINPTLF